MNLSNYVLDNCYMKSDHIENKYMESNLLSLLDFDGDSG